METIEQEIMVDLALYSKSITKIKHKLNSS